jgi:Holliday junction resolvasome RuvABC endonuclease subunit
MRGALAPGAPRFEHRSSGMIFGVSLTRDAVVIAQTTGSSETFAIKTITSVRFQAQTGTDLTELLERLVVIFDRGKSRRSTIALLGSSSGRFKSSVEAIKAEAVTELAAAKSGLPVVKVTAASLKKTLGCAAGQKWQARAAERFNPTGRHKNWSKGAAGAAAAALKVADHLDGTALAPAVGPWPPKR